MEELKKPISKRKIVGITSIVLGGILSVYGGVHLGNKVEWWADYFTDKFEAVYEGNPSFYTLEELEQENKYIKNSAYMAIGGLALIFGGSVIAGTRLSHPFLRKDAEYKSFSDYKRKVYRVG